MTEVLSKPPHTLAFLMVLLLEWRTMAILATEVFRARISSQAKDIHDALHKGDGEQAQAETLR